MKSFIGAVIFICVAFSANAQLLWKVSGNGLTQPSYIIGTHHLAPFSIMDSVFLIPVINCSGAISPCSIKSN